MEKSHKKKYNARIMLTNIYIYFFFRCGWCPYISYRRNVVERHMKEKHPAKKVFDFVIREPEDPDAPKKTEEPPAEVRHTVGGLFWFESTVAKEMEMWESLT